MTNNHSISSDSTAARGAPPQMHDLTVYVQGLEPLELVCSHENPVLGMLLSALAHGCDHSDQAHDQLMYLQFGDEEEVLYFRRSRLLALRAIPPIQPDMVARATPPSALAHSDVIFNDVWKAWIWENISRGCSKDQLFKVLIDHGFPYDAIRVEINHEPTVSLHEISNPLSNESTHTPGIYIPNADRLGSDKIELYTLDDFLDEPECQQLIELVRLRLEPSSTLDEGRDKYVRTSRTCHFAKIKDIPTIVADVTERMCKLVGLDPSYTEGLQGHIYEVGEQYKAHCDWFSPSAPDFEKHAGPGTAGQRTWTIMVYLNDTERGGETVFVNLNCSFAPRRGLALIWNNLYASGRPNIYTMHEARPVEAGFKAVLTLWFRTHGS